MDYGADGPGEPPPVAATNGAASPSAHEFTEAIEVPRHRLAPIAFNDVELTTDSVYLIKDLIPREGLAVVWGPPKCGKSFWAFDATMHIALGWEYRGRRVKQGAVVYVACEGQGGFRARIEAFRQKHLPKPPAVVPFYLVPASLDLIDEYTALINAIRKELGDVIPAVVTLDTLNRSINGDENSSEDMSAYIKAAAAIQEAFGCIVIVVHHCGVDGKRPRGHTSLAGAADAQIAISREEAGGNIITKLEWAKDGPEGDEMYSKLETMDVGIDEDGETITSCVIVPVEKEPSEKRKFKVGGQAKIALDLLGKAITDAGEIPPASNHIPGQIKVVPLTLWKGYCMEGFAGDRDNRDTTKRAVNRNIKKLQELGLIGVWGNYVWPAGQPGQGGTL